MHRSSHCVLFAGQQAGLLSAAHLRSSLPCCCRQCLSPFRQLLLLLLQLRPQGLQLSLSLKTMQSKAWCSMVTEQDSHAFC
jgi:hypothetical protein